jgi:hypothetical protein
MSATRRHTSYACYNHTMKRASEILSHLFHPSNQVNIERHRCYRLFLASLPSKWQQAIAFVFIREKTLFVALRHPGYKMELHYNRDLLKSLLTTFARLHPVCRIPEVKNVTVFSSKFYASPAQTDSTVPHYDERAEGNFNIAIDDPELAARFTSIKEHIRHD